MQQIRFLYKERLPRCIKHQFSNFQTSHTIQKEMKKQLARRREEDQARLRATPSASPAFGTPRSLFHTPQPQQQQSPFGFPTPFYTPQQRQTTPFNNATPTNFMMTQMVPAAPLPFSPADHDIQAIVDAYEEPGNPKFAFQHLLFSVTEPHNRIKPAGVSDIMWAEAIATLEGMESSKRERLWPQLLQGFRDLSRRLKLQDEVIVSDSERLKMTQSNVKMLQRHFQADTLPKIQRMQQKEQGLQRRLLRVMRIIEALEGKGSRLPMMKGEVELAEKLASITRQLKGSGADLFSRVRNLLTLSRFQADYLPGSTRIHEPSLADMQEVLQRQTEAISKLANVLKRDARNLEIIMAQDTYRKG